MDATRDTAGAGRAPRPARPPRRRPHPRARAESADDPLSRTRSEGFNGADAILILTFGERRGRITGGRGPDASVTGTANA